MNFLTSVEISLAKKLVTGVLKKWSKLTKNKKNALIEYGLNVLLEKIPVSDVYSVVQTDHKVVISINKDLL